MCQPKPGPRCAGHLRKEIKHNEDVKARHLASRDLDGYLAASNAGKALQEEFDGTRTGQQILERKIERETHPGNITDQMTYKMRMKALHDMKKEALKTARAQQAQSQPQPSPVLIGVVVPDGAHDNFSQSQSSTATASSSSQQMSSLQSMPSDQLSGQIDIYAREEYRLRSEMVGKSAKIRKQLQPQHEAAKNHLNALNDEFDRRFPR